MKKNSIRNIVGHNIRFIRRYKDLTLKHVADKVGVTVGYVSLLEGGNRTMSIEMLEKFAKALKTKMNVFLSKPLTRPKIRV